MCILVFKIEQPPQTFFTLNQFSHTNQFYSVVISRLLGPALYILILSSCVISIIHGEIIQTFLYVDFAMNKPISYILRTI